MNLTLCTITVTLTTVIRKAIQVLIVDLMEERVIFSRSGNGKFMKCIFNDFG